MILLSAPLTQLPTRCSLSRQIRRRVAHVAASATKKARTCAARARVRCNTWNRRLNRKAFRWVSTARAALSRNRLSERVANLFYSHIISMRVARQELEGSCSG